MKALLLSLLIFTLFFSELAAQQKYGYINHDSLLRLIPGFSDADSIYQQKSNELNASRQRIVTELAEKKKIYDSLRGTMSALIDTLRRIQIRELEDNLIAFDEATADYLNIDKLRLEGFHFELNEAFQIACRKKKCSTDTIPDSAYSIRVNLNKEVAMILRSSKIHAEPKRIGYVNKDSLLRLIPEYKQIKETNEKAAATYHAWYWYDSFDSSSGPDSVRSAKLDSIQRVDSIGCAPYELKFKQAWEAEMKVRKVFYIYETQVMHDVWKGSQVEFVSLNKEFAERLRL